MERRNIHQRALRHAIKKSESLLSYMCYSLIYSVSLIILIIYLVILSIFESYIEIFRLFFVLILRGCKKKGRGEVSRY